MPRDIKRTNTNSLITLFIVVIICFAIHTNLIYLILTGIWICCVYIFKIKIKLLILNFALVLCLIVWFLLSKQLSVVSLLHAWIDKIIGFSIRDKIANWISNSYDAKTSCIMNLIIFNIKNSDSYLTYNQMINLSIVYMIVISGFHLTIFKHLINKLIKNRAISNIINLIFIYFYSFLLNFSLSTIRVLLCLMIRIIMKNKWNKYDILGISGLVSIVLNASAPVNYGFCLSYLCTCIIYWIFDLNINNIFIEKILINIFVTLASLPFVILMNKQISLWAIFLSFIFTYFFTSIFIYFLLTFWIIWIAPVQNYIVNGIIYIINAFTAINVMIRFNNLSPLLISSYYYVYFLFIIFFHKRYIKKSYDTYLLRAR